MFRRIVWWWGWETGGKYHFTRALYFLEGLWVSRVGIESGVLFLLLACRKEKKMKKKKVEKEKEKVRKRCKRSELETELVIQEPFTCLEKVARKRGDK